MLQVQTGKPFDGSKTLNHQLKSGGFSSRPVTEKVIASARERCVRVQTITNNSLVHGSGLILQTNLVLTNWHLIENPKAREILVNGHPAELLHFDFRFDLAALVAPTRKLRPVKFIQVGQGHPVFYLSNPEEWNKSFGEGSVVWQNKSKIRASCPPALGVSGGGLFDRKSGKIVAFVDSMEGSIDNGCNFAVAVPAAIIEPFYKDALFKLHFRRE